MPAVDCGDGRSDDAIDITYTTRACGHGWIPMLIINGRERWSWTGKPWAQDDAIMMAKTEAEEEAARYSGDWKITVRRGPHGSM